jgi:hypothetical protein
MLLKPDLNLFLGNFRLSDPLGLVQVIGRLHKLDLGFAFLDGGDNITEHVSALEKGLLVLCIQNCEFHVLCPHRVLQNLFRNDLLLSLSILAQLVFYERYRRLRALANITRFVEIFSHFLLIGNVVRFLWRQSEIFPLLLCLGELLLKAPVKLGYDLSDQNFFF